MNKSPTPAGPPRFEGNLRHYHRAGNQTQRSWDDWVDGPSAKVRPKSKNWLRIIGITIGVLGILVIAIALIIELS
jgi:hypothetical protein